MSFFTRALLLTSALFITLSASAASTVHSRFCEENLTRAQTLLNDLDSKVPGITEIGPNEHDQYDGRRANQRFEAISLQRKVQDIGIVGNIDARIWYKDETSIYIGNIGVSENYRGQRISEVLFANLIARTPDVKMISGELAYDNLEAIRNHLKTRGFAEWPAVTSTSPTKEDLENAVKTTPFFKALSKLGFTEVSVGSLRFGSPPMLYVELRAI